MVRDKRLSMVIGLVAALLATGAIALATVVDRPSASSMARLADAQSSPVPGTADRPWAVSGNKALRFEAEAATVRKGVAESNHRGFSGAGFVNGRNATGSYVEWTVESPTAGRAKIGIRYANGSRTSRIAKISVNGTVVVKKYRFRPTGGWSRWRTAKLRITMTAGTNTIRVTTTSRRGNPNLDYLDVVLPNGTTTTASPVPSSPTPTPTPTPSDTGSVIPPEEPSSLAPTETPPVETPPVETPPVETPPVETPPSETPPVEPSVSESPSETPSESPSESPVESPSASPSPSPSPSPSGSPSGGGGVPGTVTTVSDGWTVPWDVSWAPDGSWALVTERDTLKVFKVTPDGTKTEVGTVPEGVSSDGGEDGLMGVALSPTWNGTTDTDVFFMHTAEEGNRVAKMSFDGTTLSNYQAILTGIAKNTFHDGGRIRFGPDGFLYVGTGDAGNAPLAQDPASLNGKILRITKEGQPAPGNPGGTAVYSLGHRNPQGLGWDSAGRLWESELGENTWDELNLIEAGKNYGWPTCEGVCATQGMENPKRTWATSEASPSGIAIVDDVIYMAAMRGQRLWRIPLNGTETGEPVAYLQGTNGRLRAVSAVPNPTAKALWVTTTNADTSGGQPPGSDKILLIPLSNP
ncbi:PQQ-dependent sugar dehydrogenase [Streptosporangiaceae bacterium NEAU-GS5]|nr:PQQ-dependent sugar dehydrogenase [Streptosporangiaceae bacterium NEAU-GS5]